MAILMMPICLCASELFLSRSVHSPTSYPSESWGYDCELGRGAMDEDMPNLWDFSNICYGKKSKIYTFIKNDSIVLVANKFGNTTYLLTDRGCVKASFSNESQSVEYLRPEAVLAYPFLRGDSIESEFFADGCLNHSDYLRIAGKATVKAKAIGTLVLPNEDTVSNVVLLHSMRAGGICVDPQMMSVRDSVACWETDTITFTDERWLWLSANHPLPIVEQQTATIYNHGEKVDEKHTAIVTPPSAQQFLMPTEEELDEAESRPHNERSQKQTKQRQLSPTSPMEFRLSPTITDGSFVIYASEVCPQMSVRIMNAAGGTVRNYENVTFPLGCNIGDTADGVYVVTISADGEVVYSGEVMKK